MFLFFIPAAKIALTLGATAIAGAALGASVSYYSQKHAAVEQDTINNKMFEAIETEATSRKKADETITANINLVNASVGALNTKFDELASTVETVSAATAENTTNIAANNKQIADLVKVMQTIAAEKASQHAPEKEKKPTTPKA